MSHVTFEIDGKQHSIDMYAVGNEDEFRASLEFDGVRDATKRDIFELTHAVDAYNDLLRSFIADGVFDLANYISSMECADGNHDAAEAFMRTCISGATFNAVEFLASYQGKYESKMDFARKNVTDILGIVGDVVKFIDMEYFAKALFETDYEYVDGHVFCVI